MKPHIFNAPTFWPIANARFLAYAQLVDVNKRGGGRVMESPSPHSTSDMAADLLARQQDRAHAPGGVDLSSCCFGIKVRGSFHAFRKSEGSLHGGQRSITVRDGHDAARKAIGELAGARLNEIQFPDPTGPLEVVGSTDPKATNTVIILVDLTPLYAACSSEAVQAAWHELLESYDFGQLPSVDGPTTRDDFATGWRHGATKRKNGSTALYTDSPSCCWRTAGFAFGRVFGPGSIEEVTTTFDSVLAQVLASGAPPGAGSRVADGLGRSAVEGARSYVYRSRYERNPSLRKACLEIWGAKCAVCGWSQAKGFSRLASSVNLIEVHHVVPLFARQGEHNVNPATDLVPLCPTCHRAIHSCRPPYTVEKLKEIFLPA